MVILAGEGTKWMRQQHAITQRIK